MRKHLFLIVASCLLVANSLSAQGTFSELNFPKFKNGSNGKGSLNYGAASFGNSYNAAYGSWSGFAVSKVEDTLTAGWGNQYAAMAGKGADNSSVYMVSFGQSYIKLSASATVNKFKISNSTYAYLSMKNGDSYAKKFGGDTGNEPDWFKLTVKGYDGGTLKDSVEFYLADFRFEDNTQDYIVKTWKELNLSAFGTVDSLSFALSSSDVGSYGMNTPAYFCLDNLETSTETLTFDNTDFDYWNGEDRTGKFVAGEVSYYNNFTPNAYGGFWQGFAYSKKTDVTTAGFTNQYSAITGSGVGAEDNYALVYSSGGMKLGTASYVNMKVSNSTYAYLSMQNGDSYAKKFGGDTGNEPDWFKVTVKGYDGSSLKDSVDFYLADFRFEDNTQDYILNEWTAFSLESLGKIDSLSFSFSSSDVGSYGMNTPAYMCIGEVTLSETQSVNEYADDMTAAVYPNPAKDYISLKGHNIHQLSISDLTGKILLQQHTLGNNEQLNISKLPSGVYLVSYRIGSQLVKTKLVKN